MFIQAIGAVGLATLAEALPDASYMYVCVDIYQRALSSM